MHMHDDGVASVVVDGLGSSLNYVTAIRPYTKEDKSASQTIIALTSSCILLIHLSYEKRR